MVKIDGIYSIEGADRVEAVQVGGWRIMVRKGQFAAGDLAVYFEIDSRVPAKEPFLFLEPKHYMIKTQKYFKGTVYMCEKIFQNIKSFIFPRSKGFLNILLNLMYRLCGKILFCSLVHSPLRLFARTFSVFNCLLSCEDTVSTLRRKRKINMYF